eukprot:TRINITY_DN9860_c0_g1_i4.p1 TRINITY_DN9860_c0_g1~~TRINITY_DN9860_c0_g1_i4.p1  ORF type:complete len:420 (+),score=99.43 TRINITY_DN9860_c0_g1_i4:130-1389(+)
MLRSLVGSEMCIRDRKHMEEMLEETVRVRQMSLSEMRDYYGETYTDQNALMATRKLVVEPKFSSNPGRRSGFHSTGQVVKFTGIKTTDVNDIMPTHTSYKHQWPGEEAAPSDAGRGWDKEIAIPREPLSDMAKYDITGADGKPRCLIENLLYISNAKVAQNLEGLQARGISHIINVTGFVNKQDGDPKWPNPFPEDFIEGQNYLHICRCRDTIANKEQSSRLLDLDTNLKECYLEPVVDFIKAAQATDGFGGVLIHSGAQSIMKAAALCIGYLILELNFNFTQAYGLVLNAKLDAHPHRSYMRQLMLLSDEIQGCPSKPRKLSQKHLKNQAWGTRWEPYSDRFGEPAHHFDGVSVPTSEEPDYFKIKAFTRCIFVGASGSCINDETDPPHGQLRDGFCDVHRPKPPGEGRKQKRRGKKK